MSAHLYHLGNIVIDMVLRVKDLPLRGSDTLARDSLLTPGGGFNVMIAACHQGLTTVYAGVLGTGPLASLAREALNAAHIVMASDPDPEVDTGVVVCLVDQTGERTFITSPGAESRLTLSHLSKIRPRNGDVVYISGYSLLYPSNRQALLTWLDTAADHVTVVFDPGPLVDDIPPAALASLLAHSHWVTCNAREAYLLTQRAEAFPQARALAQLTAKGQVVVRHGAEGCIVVPANTAPIGVRGYTVNAVDTNGAGDAHAGAFMAALTAGADPIAAAQWANATAAIAVTRYGPATAPTKAEVTQWLRSMPAQE